MEIARNLKDLLCVLIEAAVGYRRFESSLFPLYQRGKTQLQKANERYSFPRQQQQQQPISYLSCIYYQLITLVQHLRAFCLVQLPRCDFMQQNIYLVEQAQLTFPEGYTICKISFQAYKSDT